MTDTWKRGGIHPFVKFLGGEFQIWTSHSTPTTRPEQVPATASASNFFRWGNSGQKLMELWSHGNLPGPPSQCHVFFQVNCSPLKGFLTPMGPYDPWWDGLTSWGQGDIGWNSPLDSHDSRKVCNFRFSKTFAGLWVFKNTSIQFHKKFQHLQTGNLQVGNVFRTLIEFASSKFPGLLIKFPR